MHLITIWMALTTKEIKVMVMDPRRRRDNVSSAVDIHRATSVSHEVSILQDIYGNTLGKDHSNVIAIGGSHGLIISVNMRRLST